MRVNPSTLFLADEVDEAEGSVADGPGPMCQNKRCRSVPKAQP